MTLSATYVSADAPSAARVRTSDARRCWLTRARARGRDVDDDGSHARRSRARGRTTRERGDADVDGRHARDLDERTKSAESDKIDSV